MKPHIFYRRESKTYVVLYRGETILEAGNCEDVKRNWPYIIANRHVVDFRKAYSAYRRNWCRNSTLNKFPELLANSKD